MRDEVEGSGSFNSLRAWARDKQVQKVLRQVIASTASSEDVPGDGSRASRSSLLTVSSVWLSKLFHELLNVSSNAPSPVPVACDLKTKTFAMRKGVDFEGSARTPMFCSVPRAQILFVKADVELDDPQALRRLKALDELEQHNVVPTPATHAILMLLKAGGVWHCQTFCIAIQCLK